MVQRSVASNSRSGPTIGTFGETSGESPRVRGPRTELARAIREAYTGRFTQSELARLLGVAQNSVSRWATGDVEPCLDDIAAIEQVCGVGRGHILRSAGFVVDHHDVESALASDHRLDDARRELLLAAYQLAVEHTASARA